MSLYVRELYISLKMTLRCICLGLLPVLAGCALGRPPRRRGRYEAATDRSDPLSVIRRAAELLNLRSPPFTYDMDDSRQREQLILDLWSGQLEATVGRFSAANPMLVNLFEQQRLNDAEHPPRYRQLQGAPRFEWVLSALFRSRSSKLITLESAALAVQWMYYRVPSPVWDSIQTFGRTLMSESWVERLCDDAMRLRPVVESAPGITAAVFDNFCMKIGYSSYHTTEAHGRRLDMTNWATVYLPPAIVAPNFSIDPILGSGGIFRTDIKLEDFLDLFSLLSRDIISNQRQRWVRFMEKAARGELWEHDEFQSQFPPTQFEWHSPMYERSQSSYDDVNFELDYMRNSAYHRLADVLMLGGDGLSFMRLIHRLAQDPRQYLMTKPIVIPRLGEAPHGKFHLMHGDWRLWSPLLMKMAEVVANRAVKSDPTVETYNQHEHFLRVVSIAFAEYVLEIAASGTDFHVAHVFIEAAQVNLSFAYVVMFLFLFAFKYLEFRSAVRRNESKKLDMLWRENLGTARASNKNNYSEMSVIAVYWGSVLVEPLQTVFHNSRTLRWVHSHVGWDMPIEKLNMWIRSAVVAHVTEHQISEFISRLSFTQAVTGGVKRLAHRFRREREAATLKNVKADVELIKAFLRQKIGTTYDEATQPSDENLLEVDMSTWGGLRNARFGTPWARVERSMQEYRAYVQDQVTKLCPWHQWA